MRSLLRGRTGSWLPPMFVDGTAPTSADRIGRSFPAVSIPVVGLRAKPRWLLGRSGSPDWTLLVLAVELDAVLVLNELVAPRTLRGRWGRISSSGRIVDATELGRDSGN